MRIKDAFVVILFALATLLLLWSNVSWVKKGGVLDDALLNEDDTYRQQNLHVRSIFTGEEAVYLVKRLGLSYSEDEISREAGEINALHKRLVESSKFRDVVVVSPANVFCFSDTKDLRPNNCLDTKNPIYFGFDGKFDGYKWFSVVMQNPNFAYGLYAAGMTGRHAVFALYPKRGTDEIVFFRNIVSFLEEREITELEWLVKSEIKPKDESLMVSGWLVGRGLIDGALNSDVLKTITLGIIISMVFFGIFVRSVLQASLGALVIVLSLLWTRGEIGLLDFLGFPISERVYILLAFTNCIVQGVSFSLHLFVAYNSHRDWDKALKEVKSLIGITSIISFFGFITLWTFEIRAIRELGVVSALGVVNLYFLSIFFLPALHSLVRMGREKKKTEIREVNEKVKGFFGLISIRASFILLLLPIAIAIALLANGTLVVKSTPGDYIKGTLPERTAIYMSAPEKPGFDTLELFVEPRDVKGDVRKDASFTAETIRFMAVLQDTREFYGVRDIFGIPKTIRALTTKKFDKNGPESKIELAEARKFLEELDPKILSQFENKRGYRVSVSLVADSSATMKTARDQVEEKAKLFPGLKVSLFGKVAAYPSIDEYIVIGKPLNALTSQFSVVILFALWLFALGFKKKRIGLLPFRSGIVMSVPFLFASAGVLSVMMICGIPLDVVTAAIGAIAINASVDFSIYFAGYLNGMLLRGKSVADALTESLRHEGRIIIGDMVLNMCCFIPLFFSNFVPVQQLGLLMIVTLALSAFGTLVVMPPLFRLSIRQTAR